MCMEHRIMCHCGRKSASFNFRNEIMPPEVVRRLYCPECSAGLAFDPASMLADNGWVIEYDMDVASLYSRKLPVQDRDNTTPEMLFDEGYATWRGVYPGDHIDSVEERSRLAELARINPRQYIEEMKSWGINRMERLRKEGWRKANERQKV